MSSGDVIELSVEETNKLRAKLGLKPLRVGNTTHDAGVGAETLPVTGELPSLGNNVKAKEEEEALELSVDETNKLREKLGLAPLRDTKSAGNRKNEIHKPAENSGLLEEASQRIEQAKLRRQVEEGAVQVFGSSTLAGDDEDEASLSWADKMRKQAKVPAGKSSRKRKGLNDQFSKNENVEYNEADLEGIRVKNSMLGLEAGENAVLTLADSSILETKISVSKKVVGINEEEDALENIKLTEDEKQKDGLRRKRMLEMGMGRAGGYAGFDDDEFEELGGTLGPSSQDRGTSYTSDKQTNGGFRIRSQMSQSKDASRSDFDKAMKGEAISLVWKGDVVTSDYMTKEEELELKQKKSKKDTKFKKKKKKKKDRKRRRRTDSDEDEDEGAHKSSILTGGIISGTDVLSKLEKTSDSYLSSSLQKRRKIDDTAGEEETTFPMNSSASDVEKKSLQQLQMKRVDYDKIMEKGNERTNKAFNTDKVVIKREDTTIDDEELDDSFLNAALAKARRLNRLREMNKVSSTGANAVANAVLSTSVENEDSRKSSKISFSIDDTREFTRAIRTRTVQRDRESKKRGDEPTVTAAVRTKEGQTIAKTAEDEIEKRIKQEDIEDDGAIKDEDMEKLANDAEEEEYLEGEFEGSTARSVGVGRGLSSFVSMLKTTGEITGKHGGKEELRGRAKDERNYDNYEPLDLSKVVMIGRNASTKDQELANREVKLEYRDSHGRLLTQKEAYRDLCYQFHGHGASKRKEEKRLKQIAREQAEARMASSQVSAARDGTTAGTLGALKATQKATGKAFIVHKT